MGLAALRRILQPDPCELGDFRRRVVAVDANNLLWTFSTAMGMRGPPPKGPHGRSVAHVIGLVNRLRLYAENGIRSAWVLDGAQPALKEPTLARRAERILDGQLAGVASASAGLDSDGIRDAVELLEALGVPVMKAPGESDAQCAHFAMTGAAHAVVTQDYDALLHGAPRTARNLTKRGTASATASASIGVRGPAAGRACELYDLERVLAKAKLTRAELVDAAILVGTDYNDGVRGVGPVKAVALVRKEGTLEGALARLGVEIPEADAVRKLFLAHPVDASARIEFSAPDTSRVLDILASHGLSRERAEGVADAIAVLHDGRGDGDDAWRAAPS